MNWKVTFIWQLCQTLPLSLSVYHKWVTIAFSQGTGVSAFNIGSTFGLALLLNS